MSRSCASADPLMQVALSVFNSEWSAVTLVSTNRQMYVANAKGTKVASTAPFLLVHARLE